MAYINAAQKQLFTQLLLNNESLSPMELPEPRPEPDGDCDKENDTDNTAAFNLSFNHPNPIKSVQRKRTLLRPPAVATSREFASFMEAKEKEKEKVEHDKQQKRKEREAKKADKLAEKEKKKRTRKVPRPKAKAGTKM